MLLTYLTRQCRMAVYLSFELCVKFLCYNIPKLNNEESESTGGSLTKAEVLKNPKQLIIEFFNIFFKGT